MALYKGNKPARLWRGDHRPCTLYKGDDRIYGWRWEEQTGTDMAFEDTYNDRLGVLYEGKGYQPTKYYREQSSAGILQVAQHSEDHLRWAKVSTVAQQTVTAQGKNLIDMSKVQNPRTDTTGIWDGTTLTVTGLWYCQIPVRVQRNTNYAFVVPVRGGTGIKAVSIYSSPNGITLGSMLSSGGNFHSGENDWILVLAYANYGGSAAVSTFSQMQLELGTTPTSYAPFTPDSPSIDYPAPISAAVAAGGAVKMAAQGENLFSFDFYRQQPGSPARVTYTLTPNSATLVCTSTAGGQQIAVTDDGRLARMLAGKTVTISAEFDGDYDFSNCRLFFNCYSATQTLLEPVIYPARKTYTFTVPANTVQIRPIVRMRQSGYELAPVGSTLIVSNIQLELGSVYSGFSPFSGADYALPCQQAMYGLPGAADIRRSDGQEEHRSAFAALDGSEVVGVANEGTSHISFAVAGAKFANGYIDGTSDGWIISSRFLNVNSGTAEGIFRRTALTGAVIRVRKERLVGYSDELSNAEKSALFSTLLSSWNAAGAPLQVLFRVATPTTLTNPTQIIALTDGLNNLWSDVGTLSIGYQLPDGAQVEGDVASPTPAYPSPIISSAGALRVEGRNIHDVEAYPWSTGWVSRTNGSTGTSTDYRCTVGFIPIAPGATYTINKTPGGSNPGYALYSSPSEAGYISGGKGGTFTTPQNARYIRYTVNAGDEGTAMIISGSTAAYPYTPYRPIITHQIPELRAIPATYNPDGSVATWAARDTLTIERVGGEWHWILMGQARMRKLKDLNWNDGQWEARGIMSAAGMGSPTHTQLGTGKYLWCTHFMPSGASWGSIPSNTIQVPSNIYSSQSHLACKPVIDGVHDLASWVAWLTANDPILYYIRATPIVTDLGPVDPPLPTYYNYTHVSVEGDYPPEVTARARVVGLF